MNKIFEKEIQKTIRDIQNIRCPGDLCFAVVSDTKLANHTEQTVANIRAVDEQIKFDFTVHLGDFLIGGSPQKISRRLLTEDMAAFRNATASGRLFVAQGEADGWRDETFCGQDVWYIMTDRAWHEDTAFIDHYHNVKRDGDAPYYYVDDPANATRCIFMESELHEIDEEHKLYQKYHAWGVKQLAWLKEALTLEAGWNVLIFSHAIPESRFEKGVQPDNFSGNFLDKALSILQKAIKTHHINFVAWVCGHYGYDCEIREDTLNHIALGGLAPVPYKGVLIPEARWNNERIEGTESDDLWDAFVLKRQERKLYMIRFGAGIDRVITY